MKTFLIRTLFLVVFLGTLAAAQDVIPLYTAWPDEGELSGERVLLESLEH
jgi:hypothetical protein